MKKNKHLIAFISFAIMIAAGAVSWWWFHLPGPIEHPQNIRFAHGAAGGKSSCDTCHVTAIPFSSCTDCHTAPPVNVSNAAGTIMVQIAHHKQGGAGSVTCGDCHVAVANDARYIKVPTADHTFCGSCHSRTHSPVPAAMPGPTPDGSQLYASNCAVCHGANRQGGVGPALTQAALAGKSDVSLTGTIINGNGVMPAWGSRLTAQEIAALLQYLRNTP